MIKHLLAIFAVLLLLQFVHLTSSGQAFHKKSIVADTHNDVISQVVLKGHNMNNDLTGLAHTDVSRMKKGGLDVQVFSIFCDERYGIGTAFRKANEEIDSLESAIKSSNGLLVKATKYSDIAKAIKNHQIACLMGVEGGHMIENRMDYLESLFERGVRYMTLTWNNSTPWATSAKDETEGTLPDLKLRRGFAIADKGLDSFGLSVVSRMENMGMLVDISHVGEATFKDVLAIAKKPVIASHSSVYALCPTRRNLKDWQIKAIAKNGGVIFVNFYSGFLDSAYDGRKRNLLNKHNIEADSLRQKGLASYEIEQWITSNYPEEAIFMRPSLSQLINHIDYIVQLVGADHVGLGSDFDGIESMPQGINGVQDYPAITAALLQKGYTKKTVRKIMGGNFMRVFKEVQPN